jgi:hypothetical protein
VGSHLVRDVQVNYWPRADLTHPARVVLAAMANLAHDGDKQPTYFAGWKPLALALGYRDPEPSSPAQRAVTRALSCLVAAGIVSADPTTPRHHKRRYRLHLTATARVDTSVQLPGDHQVHT